MKIIKLSMLIMHLCMSQLILSNGNLSIAIFNAGTEPISTTLRCASSRGCSCDPKHPILNRGAIEPNSMKTVTFNNESCLVEYVDLFQLYRNGYAREQVRELGRFKVNARPGNTIITLTQDYRKRWSAHAEERLVYKDGYYLAHGTTPQGTLMVGNKDSNTAVFATSSQGGGLQAEFAGNSEIGHISVADAPQSLLECQKPLGNPVACVASCPSGTQCQDPVLSVTYTARDSSAARDYLNEKGSLDSSGLNYVFLDTLVNNTNVAFDMAITTAPLYQAFVDPTTQNITSAPGTLSAALNSQEGFSFINSIYNQQSQPESSWAIQIGSNSYPLTFLSFGNNSGLNGPVNPDGRFTLYGKNQQNPSANRLSTKMHMALHPQTSLSPSLALGASADTKDYQTIILYPRNPYTSCQPVIFIGRDSNTNVFYAATYLLSFATQGGDQCCQTSTGDLCAHDTLYCPNDTTSTNVCSQVSANQNSVLALGQQARLKVTIDPIPGLSEYGWASKIELLPGLWWPGQPDFAG